MRKQYIVQKFVMADSVIEAVNKAKRLPVHEVYLHTNWFDKALGYEFYAKKVPPTGFKDKPK